MSNRTKVLDGTTGLNNKLDPARLRFDPEDGISDLAEAVNVNIDLTGRIDRRKGYDEIGSLTNCHSYYSYGGNLYFVANGILYQSNGSGITSLRNIGFNRCSYQGIGDRVYFANGVVAGYIFGDAVWPWEVGTYVGPTTEKTYSSPPIGTHLHLYRGRMLIAEGSVVWYSQPTSYHAYDLVRNYFKLPGMVRAITSVDTGFYIGTDRELRYYHGANVPDADVSIVSNFPVVEGTAVQTNGRYLQFLNPPIFRKCAVITTHEGILALGPDGYVQNITHNKLTLPKANLGSAAVIDGKYILSLEP